MIVKILIGWVFKRGPYKLHRLVLASLFETLFEFFNYLYGLLVLSLFDDDSLVFFIDCFDGIKDVALEIKMKSLQSKLYLRYLSESEVYEVMIMSALDFLLVEFYFVRHQYRKLMYKFFLTVGEE